MNLADIFYAVAVVYMLLHLLLLAFIGSVGIKTLKRIDHIIEDVKGIASKVSVLKYTTQLSILRNLLSLFKKENEKLFELYLFLPMPYTLLTHST